MARYEFNAQRLFIRAPLESAARISLDRVQANYVRNVLRLSAGAPLLLFNGRDGEWQSTVNECGRKSVTLAVTAMTRPQESLRDFEYLFAPLKHARQDYMVEKAVEMGVSRLRPLLTRRTQTHRINIERMSANAIEAAEQCGILAIPDIAAPAKLDEALDDWDPQRLLIFCDEEAPLSDPLAALGQGPRTRENPCLALLIGPEGGFDEAERQRILKLPNVIRLALGPRILRADTAAVAALSLIQAALGDWRE